MPKRLQLSLRSLFFLVCLCGIAASFLPKQLQRHWVWYSYVAAKQERELLLNRWKQAIMFGDSKKTEKIALEYKQAQAKVADTLELILKYCNDYDLAFDEMSADKATFDP